MNEQELLDRLSKSRVKWNLIGWDGWIRTKRPAPFGRCLCPIEVLVPPKQRKRGMGVQTAARLLGISAALRQKVMQAADGKRTPFRVKLLAACKLKESKV